MSYYSEKYKILNHDTDTRECLRPSCLMKYLQETANHQMRDCGPSYSELFSEGKAFIVSRMAINQHRAISQYEEITVESWPSDRDKGATFTRSYRVSADGTELARAVGIWALVDIKTKGLLRVSDVDLSNYKHGEPLQIDGLRFRLPKEGMERVGNVRVTYHLCDCNMHMNNTNYADLFFDHLPKPEGSQMLSLSITYRKEAPLGGELVIERSLPEVNEDKSVSYYFRSIIGEDINAEAKLRVREN